MYITEPCSDDFISHMCIDMCWINRTTLGHSACFFSNSKTSLWDEWCKVLIETQNQGYKHIEHKNPIQTCAVWKQCGKSDHKTVHVIFCDVVDQKTMHSSSLRSPNVPTNIQDDW